MAHMKEIPQGTENTSTKLKRVKGTLSVKGDRCSDFLFLKAMQTIRTPPQLVVVEVVTMGFFLIIAMNEMLTKVVMQQSSLEKQKTSRKE